MPLTGRGPGVDRREARYAPPVAITAYLFRLREG